LYKYGLENMPQQSNVKASTSSLYSINDKNKNKNKNKNNNKLLYETVVTTSITNDVMTRVVEWNDKMEIEFFRAVIKNRPVGTTHII
jgi:hypothetical protein